MRARTAAFGLGGAIVLLVFAYFAWGGLGESLVYFWTPTELVAKGPAAVGRAVRLGGVVVPGSVDWNPDASRLRFRISDGATEVEVESANVPPPMFTEGIGVVVEGAYAADGVFRSHNVMVKHSNEYRAPREGKHPSEIYRDLLRAGGSRP